MGRTAIDTCEKKTMFGVKIFVVVTVVEPS